MKFDQLVKPLQATLSAEIWENHHVGIPRTLFCEIQIAIEPFEYDEETYSGPISLQSIKFPGITDWRDLASRSFTFPKNPDDGYVDGSVYVGYAHNPADLAKLTFDEFGERSVTARFEIEFDFTIEGAAEELGTPSVVWSLRADFDPAELEAVYSRARRELW